MLTELTVIDWSWIRTHVQLYSAFIRNRFAIDQNCVIRFLWTGGELHVEEYSHRPFLLDWPILSVGQRNSRHRSPMQ